MIGEALYALLLSLTPITEIVGEDITWAALEEGGPIPTLSYNTQDVKKIGCRDGGGTKTGLLEIQMLANDEVVLERLVDAVTDSLDGFDDLVSTQADRYALVLDLNTSDFDDRVYDLKGFAKVVRFDFIATKQ